MELCYYAKTFFFFQYICIAADHVSENALLYFLCFNIAWDWVCVIVEANYGTVFGDEFWPSSLCSSPEVKSIHSQSQMTSKWTIQVTVQNIKNDNPFLVSRKPTCTVELHFTTALFIRSARHYDHTTFTQTEKKSVFIFSVKLVNKTIIFIAQ